VNEVSTRLGRELRTTYSFSFLIFDIIMLQFAMRKKVDNEIIFMVEESPEGGYEAHALGYSIFSEADSLEELKTVVKDAVKCHFGDKEAPHVIRIHIVKDEVIPV
jgi:hypothetical protein